MKPGRSTWRRMETDNGKGAASEPPHLSRGERLPTPDGPSVSLAPLAIHLPATPPLWSEATQGRC